MTNSKQRMIIQNKKAEKPTPYHLRPDLTRDEIKAISHYKDLTNPQYEWKFPVRRKKGIGIDCQIINGVLREEYSYGDLIRKDKTQYTKCVNLISAAIKKSRTPKDLHLFKGVKPFDKLESYSKGAEIPQPAFSSFTTNPKKAKEYSGRNSDNYNIIFHLELKQGSRAIYIDSDEEEWILDAGLVFKVLSVERTMFEGVKAIIYHLGVTK